MGNGSLPRITDDPALDRSIRELIDEVRDAKRRGFGLVKLELGVRDGKLANKRLTIERTEKLD